MRDEILNTIDSVPTNMINFIPKSMENTTSTNVASTMSIISNDKKVRDRMDCYILHIILVVIIVLIVIAIICYHYAKYRSNQKPIGTLTV